MTTPPPTPPRADASAPPTPPLADASAPPTPPLVYASAPKTPPMLPPAPPAPPQSRHPTTWPSQRSFKDELRVRKMAYNCVPVENRGVPGQPRRLEEHEDAVFAALLASQEQDEEKRA